MLKRFVKQGSQRQLQHAEGYAHLYYEDNEREINLKKEINDAFAEYESQLEPGQKSVGIAAHRMQTLRKLFELEPADIQERVRQYCKNVDSPGYEERREFVNYPEQERNRLATALSARR